MVHRFTLVALTFVVVITGCSSTGQATFTGTFVVERLYFGRNIDKTGSVSDSSWKAFIATSVTPRFPNGFTVWPAEGQWRGADGIIVHEQSFVLEIIRSSDAAEAENAINMIIQEYKRLFHQEAVLHVSTPARAKFK